jgi:hypothetical protein
MIEPKWKLIKNQLTGVEDVVWRNLENGEQESCLVNTPEYLKWLEEGNTPLPADAPNEE